MKAEINIEFIIKNIAIDLKIGENSIRNTLQLLMEDCTIPFISRYRKERTGNLDETQVSDISDKFDYYKELEKRKETILKTIKEQGRLDTKLEKKIKQCRDKTKLEDIYAPYKPKKRTRATIAREKGLEPLATVLLEQTADIKNKNTLVKKYINPDKGVNNYEEAITGAMDIISESVSENESVRGWAREMVQKSGQIVCRAKRGWAKKPSKFQNYYEFTEALATIPSHRLLAIRRGTKEGILSWKVEVDENKIIDFMERETIKNNSFAFRKELKEAVADAYKRLIFPSVEKESFNQQMEINEREAIEVFSKNMKNLLLAPPAGSKMIMGIDPGIRTGCKVAVIDKNGDFKEFTTIYLSQSKEKQLEGERTIAALVKKYRVELISIGNGTYSKETDAFVRDVINNNKLDAIPVMVSEAGASVYSASKTARKEFPDLDLTIRGAISIARRLQDPLAELVKIDPKSIGVGQYQHDVDQKDLKKSLDRTVESCVNYVGVELNTASAPLLSYVSGLGTTVAENIVSYRSEHGAFKNRKQLLKVNKLGPKAFEQCAGFLKIRNSDNPLDNSSIHPEAYHIVEQIASENAIPLGQIVGNKQIIAKIDKKKYMTDEFGVFTLTDILNELKKPGLDPRKEFQSIRFSPVINDLEDLIPEMVLEGVVTNVTNFGAFVDIGVHQDGLVHISQLSNKFVRDPHDIVSVGDRLRIKVLEVDVPLKRISLQRLE